MPTILLLMRHGQAAPGDYPNDSLRPLTDQGRQSQRRMALWLQKEGISIDKILTSPFLRARQSSEAVAEIFDVPIEEENALSDNFSLEVLMGRLADEKHMDHIMLVGHEPTMSYLVNKLTDETLQEGFSKSCVAILRFPSKIVVGKGSLKRYFNLRDCPVNSTSQSM